MGQEDGQATGSDSKPKGAESKTRYIWEPTANEIDLIKRTRMNGWPKNDIDLALYRARVLGLNPLADQIYFERRKLRDGSYSLITTISIDAYRLQADRTGKYTGQEGPYWCGTDGKWRDVWIPPNDSEPYPYAAKVGVRRTNFEAVLWTVCRFKPYAPMIKDRTTGQRVLKAFWHQHPDGQIAKCTEAAGLRRTFPKELGRIYVTEEMENTVDGVEPLSTTNEESRDPNREPPQQHGEKQEGTPGAGESHETSRAGKPANTAERETRIRQLAAQLELSGDEVAAIERQNGGDVLAVLERRAEEARERAPDNAPKTQSGGSARTTRGSSNRPASDADNNHQAKPSNRSAGTSTPPTDEEKTPEADPPKSELAKRITDAMNQLKLNSSKRAELRKKHPKQDDLFRALTGMWHEKKAAERQETS